MYNVLNIALNNTLKPIETANELIEAGIDGILALKKTCRVCLMESKDNNLQDTLILHDEDSEASKNVLTVKDLLETSTGLKINTKEDLLPNHICNKCFLSLKTSYLFRLQSHRSEKILKCFLEKINIKRHQTIDGPKIPEIIDKSKERDATQKLDCRGVSFPCSNKNQTVFEDISVTCSSCNMTYQNQAELDKHQSEHHNMERIDDKIHFKCKYCSENYSFYYELDNHMKNCHKGVELLPCKVCGKIFRSDNTLRRHIKLTCIPLELVQKCKRPELKSGIPLQEALDACELAIQAAGFHCCLCDRKFKTETDFSNHMPEHSNNKKCKICNRIFGRSLYLESHLRKHLRKSPFKCPFCKRSFFSVISVRNHVKEHSNRATYVCNVCDKEFYAINKFIPHMKKHELDNDNVTVPLSETEDVTLNEETDTPLEALNYDHHEENESNEEIDPNTMLSCVIEQRPITACEPSDNFQIRTICKEEVDIEIEENMEEHPSTSTTNTPEDSNYTEQKNQYQFVHIKKEIGSDDFKTNYFQNCQQQQSFEITELPDNHEIQPNTMNSENNWPDELVMEIQKETTPDSDGLVIEDGKNIIDVNMAVQQNSLYEELKKVPPPTSMKNLNEQENPNVQEVIAIKRFSCGIEDCDKEFLYCPDILNHYMNEHLQDGPPFECPLCTPSVTFPYKLNLRRHLKIIHINDPYTCTICFRTSNVLREMHDHMRLHTNERPFACTKCDGKFKNRNALKVHLVTHEKNRRFRCSVCSKAFFSYNGLFLHSKSHMENKELQCQKCGRQCPTKYRLKRHMRGCVFRVGLECTSSKAIFDSRRPTPHTIVELEK